MDLEEELASNCQECMLEISKNSNFLKIAGLLSRFHRKYLIKIEFKNCKISGNFGDLDILTDAAVPETVETLVQKQPITENKVAGLDYTAFMVNKEGQSKCVMKIVNVFMA